MMYKYFSTSQFKNVIKAVHERAFYHNVDVPKLKFEGTVKLHGTNSSIYSQLSIRNFVTQSKNNIITPEEDNCGFSAFANKEKVKSNLQGVFENIKEMFPNQVETKTAVIYGEWCGSNVQKNVALEKLPKMFVVFGIKLSDNNNAEDVEDIWLNKDQINTVLFDLKSENNLYNIYKFKTWEVEIDMNNPKLVQNELIDITNQVEAQCPVGEFFGAKGIGEGVVWKCISDNTEIQVDDLVFKVKGKKHSVTKVKTIAEVDVEKVNSINEFVETVVTENRLQQGLDYLRECQLDFNIENIGKFLLWVAQDCLKEESDVLEESSLDKKEVTPVINNVAKKWFFEKLKENNDIVITPKLKM